MMNQNTDTTGPETAPSEPASMKLVSPKDHDIVGTVEVLIGVAGITNEGVTRKANGTYDFEHDGETDIDWDAQETKYETVGRGKNRRKERMFQCDQGDWWRESQLKLVPVRDDD